MKIFPETIHSDFLIHWTGIDIDQSLDKEWTANNRSNRMDSVVVNAYIERLKGTLEFGFWLISKEEPELLNINNSQFRKPTTPRTCFTELKLSETRKHAEKFGRLGIGVKRFYLFDRLGGPVKYFQSGKRHLDFPPYSNLYDESDADFEKYSFYKQMCSGRPLIYDLFTESEWRIIYSESIKGKMEKHSPELLSRFIDPKSTSDIELQKYYRDIKGRKPEYFLPLDGWLSIIIYPSPEVKNESYKNAKIRELIKKVKKTRAITGCPQYECEMWPIEVDLDACGHF